MDETPLNSLPRINSIVAAHLGGLQFSGRIIMIVQGNSPEYTIETGWGQFVRVNNNNSIDAIITY